MTKEEAAKILKLERDSWSKNPKLKVDKRLYDAVDVAIKELEKEPVLDDAAYECGYQHGYADAWNDECAGMPLPEEYKEK